MMEAAEHPQENVASAEAKVRQIMQEVYMMGANDHELSSLQEILGQLKDGELLPDVAVERARKISERKEDYH